MIIIIGVYSFPFRYLILFYISISLLVFLSYTDVPDNFKNKNTTLFRRIMNKYIFLSVLLFTTSLSFGYSITDVPGGWASMGGGTTGGQGGTEVTVSSASELKSAAGSSGKKIILVKPGQYSSFSIGSDKSILGLEPGVMVKGHISISGKSNIILRNIAIQDGKCNSYNACKRGSDAIYIGGNSKNIWLDHVDVIDGMDGNLDVSKGPDYMTVTWCKFRYTYKKEHAFSNLIAGSDNEKVSEGKLNTTYAYCWWGDFVIERMPRGRYGKIDVFNNLYTSQSTNYYVGPGHKMQMIIENNAFLMPGRMIHDWGVKGSASWKATGNIGVARLEDAKGKDMPSSFGVVFNRPYTMKIYEATEVEALVSKGAGNVLTLGQTDINKESIQSVKAQPLVTAGNAGWTLKNPTSSTLSFIVVTLRGQVVVPVTKLDIGKSFQMPSATSTLFVKFKGANAPADIALPFSR